MLYIRLKINTKEEDGEDGLNEEIQLIPVEDNEQESEPEQEPEPEPEPETNLPVSVKTED